MMFQLALLFVIPSTGVLCGAIRQIGASCPLFCPEYYHALCGTDSKTYSNECYLNAAKCRDPTIKLAHDGPCGVRRNTIVCSTPWCWPTYEPVCGSDGITYGNGCHFSNAHCYNPDLKLAHKGPCTSMPKPTINVNVV